MASQLQLHAVLIILFAELIGYTTWEMGDGRWEMGDGRWEMGDGRWEMGDGRWEMGDGRWEARDISYSHISYLISHTSYLIPHISHLVPPYSHPLDRGMCLDKFLDAETDGNGKRRTEVTHDGFKRRRIMDLLKRIGDHNRKSELLLRIGSKTRHL